MAPLENVFYWLAFFFYILAFIASVATLVFGLGAIRKISVIIGVLAFVSQTTGIIIRWYMIGHPPIFGSFENSEAASWSIILFGFFVLWRFPDFRNIGVISYPVAILLLLWGQLPFFSKHQIPLTISERSLWVDLHVVFAWFAFGSFFMAWALALYWLSKLRKFKKGIGPKVDDLDYYSEVIFKFIVFGFITFTVMLVLGSFYEFILFGKWWQWDIVESISLVTWLFYGIIIHFRLFYNWRGKGLMRMVLIAPLGLIMVYFGVALLVGKTFHAFDLPF